MNRDDVQKLLGGYATGTLTPEEQQLLFEAALDDQELFDALAREQALRDLLRDPSAKAQLLAALEHRPRRWYEKLIPAWRPVAAAAAMAGVSAIAVVVWHGARSPKRVLVAQVSPQVTQPESVQPAQAAPADGNSALGPRVAADSKSGPPVTRDLDAPAVSDKIGAADKLANEKQTAAQSIRDGVREEDGRAPVKLEAETQKRKDVAGVAGEPASGLKGDAPLPAPAPSRSFASGFRQGAAPIVGGNLGGLPPPPPAVALPPRSPSGNALGGSAGGVIGGIAGGMPAGAAPPPSPKVADQVSQVARLQIQSAPAEAKQSPEVATQSAASQSSQGQQGQQGQQGARTQSTIFQSQTQATPSQSEQGRLSKPQSATTQDTVQVTAGTAYVAGGQPILDARSLFYGKLVEAAKGAGGRGDGGSVSRKKAAEPRNTQAVGQTMAVSGSLGAAAKAMQSLLPPNLGVRYSVLRKTVTGGFEEVDPDSVKTGDTLELQLTPNYSGVLSVNVRNSVGPWLEVMSHNVDALRTYTTRQLKPGERELQVMLTRSPLAVTGVALRDEKASPEFSRQVTTEPATYVVGGPGSQQLHFTITLSSK